MTENPKTQNKKPVSPEFEAYRVLARKYRPKTFADLIGQEVMVKVLTNAIVSGRLAHSFILTGVRGVGKTTTARIIARALNCVGLDGSGSSTDQPCGQCEHCRSIAEDRDVDVIEMDAASRTGVDDIRELIEGVRYKPVAARYKVYIIDEVHMLSKNAFNALLKTLEEPPEHVKFIFATTEIRKVPVTVMSRCQRFDLRRVDVETLTAHLIHIVEQEGAAITHAAAMLIARAADGSVRDGLSLLDTAISTVLTESPAGEGEVSETQIRAMLGLADRTQVLELLDTVMRGDPAAALAQLEELYASGADPVIVIQDLLVLCHWLTRLKVLPEAAEAPEVPEAEVKQGLEMASRLTIPVLTRAWQILLKGLAEVQMAPAPLVTAEMVLVRLAYSSDLPTPAEIARDLNKDKGGKIKDEAASRSYGGNGGKGQAVPPPLQTASTVAKSETVEPSLKLSTPPMRTPLAPDLVPLEEMQTDEKAEKITSFRDVVTLAERYREGRLQAYLINDVHLVSFEPGRIEFRPGPQAPAKLAGVLSDHLGRWTGERWVVSVSQAKGDSTLREQMQAAEDKTRAEAEVDPLVRAVLDAFPGSTITAVRHVDGTANPEGDDPQ